MEIYLSSESLDPKDLSHEEHYFTRIDSAREYFGFKEERNNNNPNLKNGYGITHSIDKWFNDDTPRDKLLRPLDIIYVKNENPDRSFWIPFIEYTMLKEFTKMFSEVYNFDIGFITGRSHYLGKFASEGMSSATMTSGYQIWLECKPFGFDPTPPQKCN